MSQKNEFLDGFFLFLIIIILAITASILKFSNTFHLDFATGLRVVIGMATACGIAIVLLKFSVDPRMFYTFLPLIIAGIWASWWPAMDFWAMADILANPHPLTDADGVVIYPWYATNIGKYGVALFIIAVGYGIRKIVIDGRRD